jgi:hypothetical protein
VSPDLKLGTSFFSWSAAIWSTSFWFMIMCLLHCVCQSVHTDCDHSGPLLARWRALIY